MAICNYEEVDVYPLDPEMRERILLKQKELTFMWGTRDHWAVGVLMSYVWREGRFWISATSQRKRIAAIRRDPRVSVSVTSNGTGLGDSKGITAKGRCIIHESDDTATQKWFYPALAEAVMGGPGKLTSLFAQMLDSERRLIIEIVPEKWITFDSTRLMAESIEAWKSEGLLD